MWAVVHFTTDNSVEVVPSTWYDFGTCAWPSKKANPLRTIKSRILPNKQDFQWLKARKFGSYGKYIFN